MIFKKSSVIIIHILIWLIFFVVFPILLYVDSMYDVPFLKRTLLQTLFYILVFYINYFILIPIILFKSNKKINYYFSLLVLIIGFTIFFDYTGNHLPINNKKHEFEFKSNYTERDKIKVFPRPSKRWPTYNFLITSLLISGFGLGLRFSEKMIYNDKLRKETEKQKLHSELAFLKNQISPHFFFNTLNNIYSLIEINAEESKNALLQLSKLMRYLLYESDSSFIQLSKEIEFMKSYVELMKLRLSPKVKLKVKFPEKADNTQIPPLLFVSFIENAFKHGISYREPSFINIDMSISDKEIVFWCSNSVIDNNTKIKDISSKSGIGLENVRKRLELLFPNKYNLVIRNTQAYFSVMLTIDILKSK